MGRICRHFPEAGGERSQIADLNAVEDSHPNRPAQLHRSQQPDGAATSGAPAATRTSVQAPQAFAWRDHHPPTPGPATKPSRTPPETLLPLLMGIAAPKLAPWRWGRGMGGRKGALLCYSPDIWRRCWRAGAHEDLWLHHTPPWSAPHRYPLTLKTLLAQASLR